MDLPEALIATRIDRGSILHTDCIEGVDHGKFFVIMGISQDEIAGFFFINSRIHPSIFIKGKQEQLNLQYPMRRVDYPFLKYDSFLCATNIITLEKSKLVQDLKDGTARCVFEMKREHMEEILGMVRGSKVFSKIEKDSFFYK